MKRLLSITALWVGLCAVALGQTTTRTVDATGFTGLRLSGDLEVSLEESTQYSVELTGDAETLDMLVVEVRGNDLVVRPKQDEFRWGNRLGTVTVHLKAPKVERVETSGAIKFRTLGTITPARFRLGISGSGRCDIAIETTELSVSTSGSSDVLLRGTAQSLELHMSGSGDISAFELAAQDVSVSTSGSANVEVSASRRIEVSTSGSSNIRYRGAPTDVNISTSGSGRITKVG